jgi:hypothetical protein
VFEYFYTGKSKDNPEYRFPVLTEIEQFLQKHYHLPNIPSAEMIQDKGGN